MRTTRKPSPARLALGAGVPVCGLLQLSLLYTLPHLVLPVSGTAILVWLVLALYLQRREDSQADHAHRPDLGEAFTANGSIGPARWLESVKLARPATRQSSAPMSLSLIHI